MAGTQPVQHSSTAAELVFGSAAATAAGARGPERPPAQVLTDLLDKLTALLTAVVNPMDQDQHNVAIEKLRDEIAHAKEELSTENTRMAEERAALDAQAQRIQSQSYWLMLDQNASNEVMRRRHQTRLPSVYEARNLFNTPGAGTSNPAVVNRAEAPGTGTPVQPHTTDPPRQNNNPPQHMPMPLGHYSNPLDNMIAGRHDWRLSRLKVNRRRRLKHEGLESSFR